MLVEIAHSESYYSSFHTSDKETVQTALGVFLRRSSARMRFFLSVAHTARRLPSAWKTLRRLFFLFDFLHSHLHEAVSRLHAGKH